MTQKYTREFLYNAFLMLGDKQDITNERVVPDWKKQDPPLAFHRAVWTEAGEAMGYLNWEFWKKKNHTSGLKDLAQFSLELSDILHFGISMVLREVYRAQRHATRVEMLSSFASRMADAVDGMDSHHAAVLTREQYAEKVGEEVGRSRSPDKVDAYTYERYCQEVMIEDLESVAQGALANKFHFVSLLGVANAAGIGLEGLLANYLGKNVLNNFRNANGYKTGSYIKNWNYDPDQNDYEDNVFLARVIRSHQDEFAGVFFNMIEAEVKGSSTGFSEAIELSLIAEYGKVEEAYRRQYNNG